MKKLERVCYSLIKDMKAGTKSDPLLKSAIPFAEAICEEIVKRAKKPEYNITDAL